MNETLRGRARQREVWSRARAGLGLVDVRSEVFALSGLGARVPDLTTRMLIQPSDPENAIAEFDQELWKRAAGDYSNHPGAARTRAGFGIRTTREKAANGMLRVKGAVGLNSPREGEVRTTRGRHEQQKA